MSKMRTFGLISYRESVIGDVGYRSFSGRLFLLRSRYSQPDAV